MEEEFTLFDIVEKDESDWDKCQNNKQMFYELITKHFEELSFKQFDTQFDEETKTLQITITLEQFSMKFLALCTIIMSFTKKRIDCKSYIAKPDGQLIQVKEKYLQRLLARYFCRINNTLRFGCFCIENETGQIQLKLNSIMISEHWNDMISLNAMQKEIDQNDKNPLSNLFKVLHYTSHYAIGYHIYRLMHLINKLSYKVFPFLEQKLQNQYRKIHPQFDKNLQKINEIVQNKCTQEITYEDRAQYQQHFSYPKNNNAQIKILNTLQLLGGVTAEQIDSNAELIGEGGFSVVKKTQISFQPVIKQPTNEKQQYPQEKVCETNYSQNNPIPWQKRTIVIKKDKLNNDKNEKNDMTDRISHEKKVLELLSQPNNEKQLNGHCPYIAQFYKVELQEFDNILFMEYYQHTSLDNFRSKFQATQSLNTRLYILFQIAHALRYLQCYGVIHNDIKPANILLGKHYFAKLTDFGEAIYKDGDQFKFGGQGRTFPFAAPESLGEEQNKAFTYKNINPKSDIFSFGILMYEFLFEYYPIDFKKSNPSNLSERYRNKTYQIRSNIDFIKTFGPKHLMKCLRNLAIKCLNPDPTQRPNIEWIIIVIKEGLIYLEKMY